MSESQESAPIRVVIVDDHQVVREGLATLINAQANVDVVGQAGDVEAGLAVVEEQNANVLLTDISMPGADPFVAVKAVLEKNPSLNVIFITAFGTDANLRRAIDAGCNGVILKNDPASRIIEAIQSVHAGEFYFSPEIADKLTLNEKNVPSMGGEVLSEREIQILCHVAKGMKAKDIATKLEISAKTVERHKSNIMLKLNMHSQVDLTRYAIREGFIAP